jgi:hypothetical protein
LFKINNFSYTEEADMRLKIDECLVTPNFHRRKETKAINHPPVPGQVAENIIP